VTYAHIVGFFPAQANGDGLYGKSGVGDQASGHADSLVPAGKECKKSDHGRHIGNSCYVK